MFQLSSFGLISYALPKGNTNLAVAHHFTTTDRYTIYKPADLICLSVSNHFFHHL